MPRESFKEFRQITQGTKLEKRRKKKDWWHWIYTFFSRYITWILVKTPITANFITLTGLLIGLVGLFLIGIGNNIFIIIGFILLYIYYVSDEVDGEVARYKKQTSLRGIYYDEIGHLFFQGWFFFSFGYSIYRINSEFLYIILAFIATFFLIGIRTVRKISIIAFAKGDIKNKGESKTDSTEETPSKKSFIKGIKSISINLVNAFSHTHMITTMFFIGFLLYIFFEMVWVLEFLIISYVLFLLLVFLTFMILKSRSIEKDALKQYEKKFLENP
ncbi:MAG: CDP-alcohol phosphatidyltransferase family protein [Candidatus Lokiarchaeota archaeon]|nr:CDP-alcohol phosphatidyltransferase family protein [Candidatus Lokiarchaeota archaeon]